RSRRNPNWGRTAIRRAAGSCRRFHCRAACGRAAWSISRIGSGSATRSRVADVQIKEGRSGTLCFVTVEHEYRTERGRALAERQDIVYREADSATQADGPPETRPAPTWRRTLSADAVMLFRYSALTFNGHRIHYDR